ncbi:MAG TPA: ATP-binding protein [Gammaproteobacteria bacterium]|nr:ATP-binding protein [Gammaproteobacteria bacterium]
MSDGVSQYAAIREASPHHVIRDLAVVIALTLLSIFATSYFELDEWLYARTRQWELFQIDELPVTLAVLALGLVWFSTRRHQQTRLELGARREAEARLAHALGVNRELAQQHIRTQESERKHLARELHDELGQYLNAIKLDAVSIRDNGGRDAALAGRAAAAIIQSVDHVHAAVSGMIRRLRPVGLDELGLTAAIENCVDHWRARVPAMRVSLDFDGDLDGLGEQLNLAVYRLIQEGLTNCSRHSGATRMQISLRRGGANGADELMLAVQDDGRGADLGATRAGFGLSGMQERVEMLGGRFEVVSEVGRGLRFEARLPVAGRQA